MNFPDVENLKKAKFLSSPWEGESAGIPTN
jgi:hypothetical protein